MTDRQLRGLFVTGTDTGVGKTVVSAALLQRLRGAIPVRYWKPIQTGIEADDDTAAVRCLSGCRADETLDDGIRLRGPFSPHLSARLARTTIVLDDLVSIVNRQPALNRWIVEGAGGVLVPVNDADLMIDLMVRLALPVLVVARTALGTINHTLLTIQALRARQLSIAGVVMVGERNDENRQAIERYGSLPVVGELRHVSPLTSETLVIAAQGIDLSFIVQLMDGPR